MIHTSRDLVHIDVCVYLHLGLHLAHRLVMLYCSILNRGLLVLLGLEMVLVFEFSYL